MYPDLRTFVNALEAAGELVRIREPVSAVLEVATIADRVSRAVAAPHTPSSAAIKTDPRFHNAGGPALLFERVHGSDMPVLINAFGSYRRVEMAMGVHAASSQGGSQGLEGLAARIGELVKPQPPRGLAEAIAKARQFAPLLKIGPKRLRGRGACQEIIEQGEQIDLTRLPILRCWPLDGDYESVGYPPGINDVVPGLGHPQITSDQWEAEYRGRYITLAGIHTVHSDERDEPKPSSHNIGMYRVQLLGKDKVAMHWHMHHDGARHWRSWKKLGQPMPVAIALGGSSVLPYAATAPLPPGISELLMAGFLGGSGVRMVRGVSVPLWVPADAEIVIEGYASYEAGPIGWDPRLSDEPLGPGAVFEGPFGDHTGFYSMPDRYPVVTVTAVTRRRNAIYPTTVVGPPPQEDYFLGKATERLFLPLLKVLIPDIEDYDLPIYGAFHNCANLAIDKHYPLQGRRVMHSVWGAGQMAWTKTIFVVRTDVDVHNSRSVLEAASSWCDPARDIEKVRGPLDILDHAAPHLGAGTKVGFDCTPKWPDEEAGSSTPISKTPHPRQWVKGDDAARHVRAVCALDGVRDAAMPDLAPGWLFVSAYNSEEPGHGRKVRDGVLGVHCDAPPPFVVIVSEQTDPADADRCLFEWLAHADAGRDMRVVDHSSGGRMGVDATPKVAADGLPGEPVRAWPPALVPDGEVAEQVTAKWANMFAQS